MVRHGQRFGVAARAVLALVCLWAAGAAAEDACPPAPCPAPPPDKGFVGIFNGKDLAGWTPSGAAEWLVRDGCLVGTQTDGKGGDLTHEKVWDHFDLRCTYRVKWPANSGIWFRFDKGRGYQFDILKWKRPVAFSGTLYCPGKMFITANLNEAIEDRDDWNEARIWAVGERLILWLNGKRVSDCRDSTLAKGKIGLQVHGGAGFKGMEIVIKRLEVRPLAADTPAPEMTESEKPPAPPAPAAPPQPAPPTPAK